MIENRKLLELRCRVDPADTLRVLHRLGASSPFVIITKQGGVESITYLSDDDARDLIAALLLGLHTPVR